MEQLFYDDSFNIRIVLSPTPGHYEILLGNERFCLDKDFTREFSNSDFNFSSARQNFAQRLCDDNPQLVVGVVNLGINLENFINFFDLARKEELRLKQRIV